MAWLRGFEFLRSGLARLLTESLGEGWLNDLSRLRALEPLARDAGFRERWRAVKRKNKQLLAEHIRRQTRIVVDPEACFDVQVKRIHEYKRQHLNALYIVALYRRLLENPQRRTGRTSMVNGPPVAIES